MRKILAYWLLMAGLLGSTGALAAESVRLSIHNHHYDVLLHSNRELLAEMGPQPDALSPAHYRGRLSQLGESWLRVSQVNGRWQGLVSIGGEMYLIDMSAAESALTESPVPVLVARPVSDLKPVACGCDRAQRQLRSATVVLDQPPHSAMLVADQVQFASLCDTKIDGVCLLAELEVVFDQQFQQELGSDAREQAAALLNMVEGYYRNDLGVVFDTITMEFLGAEVFSSTTNASDLLNDINRKRGQGQLAFVKSNSSLLHLVTGRDFDGGTAGIAFVDALCNRSGVGTTELLNNFSGSPNIASTALVMAHELGHNFGAGHDGDGNNCGAGFIMAATVNASAQGFSDCSIASMQNSISSINSPGACFNFPIDLQLVAAAGNPVSAPAAQELVLDYDVQTAAAYQPVSALRVSGTVPADQGRFSSVTINGNACAVAGSGLSYECSLASPASSASLQLRLQAAAGATELTVSSRVDEQSSPNTKDILPDNNSLDTRLPVEQRVPAAPSNLLVEQRNTSVRLDWTDNSDDEVGFRIERRRGGGNFTELVAVAADTASYIDRSVQVGSSYSYRVIATGTGADSSATNTATIAVVAVTPAAPSALSASQGSGTQVTLSWRDNSDNETGFRVERRAAGGSFAALGDVAAGVTDFTDTTAAASINYQYRVVAVNDAGDSAVSPIAAITPTAPTAGNGGGGGAAGWPLVVAMAALVWLRRRRLSGRRRS